MPEEIRAATTTDGWPPGSVPAPPRPAGAQTAPETARAEAAAGLRRAAGRVEAGVERLDEVRSRLEGCEAELDADGVGGVATAVSAACPGSLTADATHILVGSLIALAESSIGRGHRLSAAWATAAGENAEAAAAPGGTVTGETVTGEPDGTSPGVPGRAPEPVAGGARTLAVSAPLATVPTLPADAQPATTPPAAGTAAAHGVAGGASTC
ncbi:hypothetical protein [Allostreptomyces psammosilenae]|uniref:Uncharacterized protein n=1 Tax=Allostreptomyces psammosilenae TaxID=1892865 RepID=A0A853A8H1_9ACTN|nr:hypothetical protein [Allostreptomyces psammosilenae]NYI06732.1 hypothetical protein [Allostreptomyces psammosilenae]